LCQWRGLLWIKLWKLWIAVDSYRVAGSAETRPIRGP
jgi:hypothetical protein